MQKITVSAKCADLCTITGVIGESRIDYDDYVPSFLGSYGDYVELEIDLDTMKVVSIGPHEVIDGKLTGITKEDILEQIEGE